MLVLREGGTTNSTPWNSSPHGESLCPVSSCCCFHSHPLTDKHNKHPPHGPILPVKPGFREFEALKHPVPPSRYAGGRSGLWGFEDSSQIFRLELAGPIAREPCLTNTPAFHTALHKHLPLFLQELNFNSSQQFPCVAPFPALLSRARPGEATPRKWEQKPKFEIKPFSDHSPR